MTTVRIYQIKDTENCDYTFASWRIAEKYFNMNDYEEVYSYETDDADLDEIYYIFNMEHPADFRGHSLSVSDIIELDDGVDVVRYYVDSFGFKKI